MSCSFMFLVCSAAAIGRFFCQTDTEVDETTCELGTCGAKARAMLQTRKKGSSLEWAASPAPMDAAGAVPVAGDLKPFDLETRQFEQQDIFLMNFEGTEEATPAPAPPPQACVPLKDDNGDNTCPGYYSQRRRTCLCPCFTGRFASSGYVHRRRCSGTAGGKCPTGQFNDGTSDDCSICNGVVSEDQASCQANAKFTLVDDGKECGDAQVIELSTTTSDPQGCANLAIIDARCGAYFEVRKERNSCRCNPSNTECAHSVDSNTILYQLQQQAYHLAPPGAASCDYGTSPSMNWCLDAVQSLASSRGATLGRIDLQEGSGGSCLDGSWGQVPGGCSSQSGGDWAAHYKSGTPTLDGCVHSKYQLVCTGQDAPTDAPTEEPTDAPTDAPTDSPTLQPTDEPTNSPMELMNSKGYCNEGYYRGNCKGGSPSAEDIVACASAEACIAQCAKEEQCKYAAFKPNVCSRYDDRAGDCSDIRGGSFQLFRKV